MNRQMSFPATTASVSMASQGYHNHHLPASNSTSPSSPSTNYNSTASPFNRDSFAFRSLPRRGQLFSVPGSPIPDLNLDCECPFNQMAKSKQSPNGVLRSNSATVVRPETSLNEVVEKFEEVFRDHRNKLSSRLKFATMGRRSSDQRSCSSNSDSSPPIRWLQNGFKLGKSNSMNCGNFRAFALMRQNTLPANGFGHECQDHQKMLHNEQKMIQDEKEHQVRQLVVNTHEDEVNDKFKESCFIVKKNASWSGSRRSDFTITSPEISPNEQITGNSDHCNDGAAFGSLGSTSTNTTRSTSADSAIIASCKELTYESVEGVTIDPRDVLDTSSPAVSVRSIGISTNFAPSLSRRSTPPRNQESIVFESRSTCTVPIGCEDVMCQTIVPDRYSRGTETILKSFPASGLKVPTRHVGISVVPDPGYNESTQTYKVAVYHESVQVNEKCPTCENKQTTSTIAIGDCGAWTKDIATGPDDDMFERLRRERQLEAILKQEIEFPVFKATPVHVNNLESFSNQHCDQEQEAIGDKATSSATSSPVMSRIPRLTNVVEERRSSGEIVIEETCNEILVYRRPESLVNEIVPPGKHRAFLPQMIAEEDQHLISACKIQDDDEGAVYPEDMSESSDEESFVARREMRRRPDTRAEPSKEMKEALNLLNQHLLSSGSSQIQEEEIGTASQIIEGEWFKVSSSKSSDAFMVEDFLDYFESLSSVLLNHVVNLTDVNGNTAMHYAISYSNFDAASVLLDSKVCDVNKLNKAGYSALMLVSLSKITDESQKAVVKRLFQLGDVNLKAKQNGQTALMLAASHGQAITTKLLLETGAAVNVQDSDGSTALMCAAEHNHLDVVKILLSHHETNPNITDNEGSTALSIAMAAGHKDIGLVVYAATNVLSRGSSAYSSLRRPSQAIATSLRRTGSFNIRSTTESDDTSLQGRPATRGRIKSSSRI